MSEIIDTSKTQPQAVTSVFDRLSRDFDDVLPDKIPAVAVEAPVITAAEETAKLEGEIKEEVVVKPAEPAPIAEAVIEEPIGFEEKTAVQEEAEGWRPIIEALGYQLPEDYNEEKGFEILTALKEAELNTKLQEVKNYRETEIFGDLPEDIRDEAKLTFELFKSGQTLEQINAPIQQIKEWKGMSKEELIRSNLEGIPGYTPEMIDHKMAQIVESGHVDIEYQILANYVNQKEAELTQQRQQQIQIYNNQQSQIRAQKQQQDFNSFKAALDKVPTFMDRKLSDDNKTTILNEFNNGYIKNLTQNPEKLAKFMLYDKYGEQGLKYLQDRAIEKATLEKAKSQLNIPPTTTGAANSVETTTMIKNGMDRLAQDTRYA